MPRRKQPQARAEKAYGQTTIPVAFLDGEPVMAFETRTECDKANLVAAGAKIVEVPFTWDADIAKQRIDERLGLLNVNEQMKDITKYMLAYELSTMASMVTISQAVILVLERRLKRRIARLFAFVTSRRKKVAHRIEPQEEESDV